MKSQSLGSHTRRFLVFVICLGLTNVSVAEEARSSSSDPTTRVSQMAETYHCAWPSCPTYDRSEMLYSEKNAWDEQVMADIVLSHENPTKVVVLMLYASYL